MDSPSTGLLLRAFHRTVMVGLCRSTLTVVNVRDSGADMAPTRRDVLISTAAMAGVPAWRCGTPDAAAAAQQPSESLQDLLSISDFQEAAPRRMSHMRNQDVEGGAADEITLRWNQEALQRLRICPRVLTDVSRIDTRVTLFGQQHPVPILLAPTGYHATMHPEGEVRNGAWRRSRWHHARRQHQRDDDDRGRRACGNRSAVVPALHAARARLHGRPVRRAEGCRLSRPLRDRGFAGRRPADIASSERGSSFRRGSRRR